MHGLGLVAAGITGAGIGSSVPFDAKARVKHHLHELQKALGDSYPTMRVTVSARYEGGLPALIVSVIPAGKQLIPPPPETAIG